MSELEGVQTDQYANILEDFPGSMHINERKFIKLCLSKQDLVIEKYLDDALEKQRSSLVEEIRNKVSGDLAETIRASNQRMFEVLDKQNEQIAAIKEVVEEIKKDNVRMKEDIACYERDIRALKAFASRRNTFIRMAIVFFAALAAFLGIHKLWL